VKRQIIYPCLFILLALAVLALMLWINARSY
jgi:hypothetical protein